MTPTEREVVASYGEWKEFCQTFGLKPSNPDDNEEAVEILHGLARQHELGGSLR